jgi:hypothetical protein
VILLNGQDDNITKVARLLRDYGFKDIHTSYNNIMSEPSGNRSLMQWVGCLKGATEEKSIVAKGRNDRAFVKAENKSTAGLASCSVK